MSIAVAVVVVPLLFGASPDPRLRAGVMLHDAGNYEGAIKVYRAILKDRPHDAAAVYELAFTMVAHQENDAAIAFVDQELKSGVAQSPRLYSVQASAFDARGEYAKGEAALRKGLTVEPNNAELAYNLGVNLGTRDRWDEAIEAFSACAAAAPENPSGWWGLGRSYEAMKQKDRAVVAYARAALTRAEKTRLKAAAERVVALSTGPAELARALSEDTYFQEARAKGHLEAVAHELRRLGGDASAELWCAENAARVTAYREWAAVKAQ